MWLSNVARDIWRSLVTTFAPRRRIRSYPALVVSAAAPRLEDVQNDTVYIVETDGRRRWAMMCCPCGCKEVITLSLQQIHDPYWKLLPSANGLATLRPSIWRREGCRSHFWVRDGQVHWA
jgi:hypothetical protein